MGRPDVLNVLEKGRIILRPPGIKLQLLGCPVRSRALFIPTTLVVFWLVVCRVQSLRLRSVLHPAKLDYCHSTSISFCWHFCAFIIHSFIHSFIHSVVCLNDRSIASTKASSGASSFQILDFRLAYFVSQLSRILRRTVCCGFGAGDRFYRRNLFPRSQ